MKVRRSYKRDAEEAQRNLQEMREWAEGLREDVALKVEDAAKQGVDLGISQDTYRQDRKRAKARALMNDERAPAGERDAARRAFEALRLEIKP